MANVKISQLTAAASLAATDQFEVNAGGSSASVTAQKVADFLASVSQTLTNKTFNTADTGNVFKINGTAISAVTGTGSVVLSASPTLTTPLFTGVPVGTVAATNGTIEGLKLVLNASTPAANDSIYTSFWVNNSDGMSVEVARTIGRGNGVTAGSETGQLIIATRSSGVLTNRVVVGSTAFTPGTNGGIALGTNTMSWSDLFLASGGLIRWGNGAYTLTHSASTLTTSGALTLGGALTYGGVTLSNSVTGTGSMVLSASPTLTGTLTAATVTASGVLTGLSGTAVGAGANTQAFIKASSTANLGIYYGTGDPAFAAAKGSLYCKTDATTTTTRLWVNTDGSTTWTYFTANA